MSGAAEGELDKQVAEQLEQLKSRFEAAMNDDLNTSVALSVVFDLVRLANKLLQDGNATAQTLGAVDEQFGRLGGDVLGIVKDNYSQSDKTNDVQRYELAIDGLVELRNKARREKNFSLADEVRVILGSVGIVLEDKPDGTTWRLG
jgi:cysteinyl-tRNA synthetase